MKNKNILKTVLAAPLLALALSVMPQSDVIAQQANAQEKPYTYVEQMPQFKGGEGEMLKFLGSNIKYPKDAIENGLEGMTVLSFVVETDGTLSEVQTVKKLSPSTDAEAIRVVKQMSGHWTSGQQNGKAVRVRYTLPIKFALRGAEKAAAAEKANRMPAFKGGPEAMQQTMQSYLSLPTEAKKENLNARVVVKFYVDKAGQVSNLRLEGTKLKKTVGPGSELDYMDASTFQLQNKAILAKLSESAMSAVKATSGKWEPALKNGQPVGSELVLPVQFLSSESGRGSEKLGVPNMTKHTKNIYKAEEVDVKPSFKDGSFERYLARTLRYPASVEFEGPIGLVYTVKADGTIMHMIPTSIGKELHDIISNAFEKSNGMWNAGKVDSQAVGVIQTITILFVTENSGKKHDLEKADVIVTRHK